MRIETKRLARFKESGGGRPSSIIHEGEYVFSATEARFKHKLVDETEEFIIEYVYYSDDPVDMKAAFDFMPDYQCWDSTRRVLGREKRSVNE
jgi:hypothetical protein